MSQKTKKSGGKQTIEKIQQLREFFGEKCEQCGSTEDLQFAHRHGHETGLNGSSRGSWYRFKDVALHPASYLLLCRSCHWKYDRSNKQQLEAKP